MHETEEKLTKLREGYRTVCEVLEKELRIPAKILDGSLGIEEVADAALQELGALVPAPLVDACQQFIGLATLVYQQRTACKRFRLLESNAGR